MLFGQLDGRTVGLVRQELQSLVDGGVGEVHLDVSGAQIADSCGLALLVSLHRRAKIAGRTLVLIDVSARLNFLLRHTRLHRVIACRSSGTE